MTLEMFLNLKDIQWREIIGYYLDFYKDLYDPNLSLKDRSFRTSFIIGYRIGIIIVAIYVIWFLYWLYRGITLGDWS